MYLILWDSFSSSLAELQSTKSPSATETSTPAKKHVGSCEQQQQLEYLFGVLNLTSQHRKVNKKTLCLIDHKCKEIESKNALHLLY